MKHITFGDSSLLVGDEVVDTLLEYAAGVLSEPDNSAAIEYMKGAMMRALIRPSAVSGDTEMMPNFENATDETGPDD
jgi:hypothetical protein